MSAKVDIVGVIEASYRVDQGEAPWLDSILEAGRPGLDRGLGLLGAGYDLSETARPHADAVAGFDLPDGFDHDMLRQAFGSLSTDCVRSLRTTTGCHLIRWDDRFCDRPANDGLASLPVVPSPFGPSDLLVINAVDPTGRGCFVSTNLRRGSPMAPATRLRWNRLATHLSAGLRLRRRLADGARRPEAVLTPDGRLEHAEGEARSLRAREVLQRAVAAQERARGPLGRRAPDDAVAEWRGLIAARWTLLDHFESGGKRYLFAERNDPQISWIDTLTPREQQVVAYASLGHSSKQIAYDLGIADSTVRVLLVRAAARAGAASTRELVERYCNDHIPASPTPRT